MNIPAADHLIWRELVIGRVKPAFEHLGLQILMGRAKVMHKADPSDRETASLAKELHDFFIKNEFHPKIQRDITKLYD